MLGETEAIGGQMTLWPGLPGDSAVSEVRARLVCEECLGFRNSQWVSNLFFSLTLATWKWKTRNLGCVVKARLKALSPTAPTSWRCSWELSWEHAESWRSTRKCADLGQGPSKLGMLQEAPRWHRKLKAGPWSGCAWDCLVSGLLGCWWWSAFCIQDHSCSAPTDVLWKCGFQVYLSLWSQKYRFLCEGLKNTT